MKNKKVELTKEEKIRKEIRERGKKQGIKIGQKLGIMQVAKKMLNVKVNEKVVRELTGLTEEEIESYSGCSERTQRCLTDCPWPFPGSYINAAS